MSHCAPETTLKTKCFEFTPKTVITDVFVAQGYWEAVPKMWPGGSKASVHSLCVVHASYVCGVYLSVINTVYF